MHRHDDFTQSVGGYPFSATLRPGAAARLVAAMAGRDGPASGRPAYGAYAVTARESDRAYFGRRSAEEREAAQAAACVEARNAHRELASLYARLAIAPAAIGQHAHAALPSRRRIERQEALLDAGLMETFPASDPVSVVRID